MKVKKINFSKNNSSYTTEIFNSQPIFYCKPPQYSMNWARMFIPFKTEFIIFMLVYVIQKTTTTT
jgi:hypothetical protein